MDTKEFLYKTYLDSENVNKITSSRIPEDTQVSCFLYTSDLLRSLEKEFTDSEYIPIMFMQRIEDIVDFLANCNDAELVREFHRLAPSKYGNHEGDQGLDITDDNSNIVIISSFLSIGMTVTQWHDLTYCVNYVFDGLTHEISFHLSPDNILALLSKRYNLSTKGLYEQIVTRISSILKSGNKKHMHKIQIIDNNPIDMVTSIHPLNRMMQISGLIEFVNFEALCPETSDHSFAQIIDGDALYVKNLNIKSYKMNVLPEKKNYLYGEIMLYSTSIAMRQEDFDAFMKHMEERLGPEKYNSFYLDYITRR